MAASTPRAALLALALLATLAPAHAQARVRDPLTVPLTQRAPTFRPVAALAVGRASKRDIVCAAPGERHTVLAYAHVADRASRAARLVPVLRREAYRMSAFVRSEARALHSGRGYRLRLLCEGDVPVVRVVALSTPRASTTPGSIEADLRRAGVASDTSSSAIQHAVVYADGAGFGTLAGIAPGGVDDSAGPGNAHLGGGRVAIQFSTYSDPYWPAMLHELSHALGAVQESSAHGAGAGGHCTDGPDVMCLPGVPGYQPGVCATISYDCNGDDYFHPQPDAGSYLATHWNLASPFNTYFAQGELPLDRLAPSRPRAVRVSRVGLASWRPAGDDTGVAGYLVECNAGRGWVPLAITPGRRYDLYRYLCLQYRVSAVDAVGRASRPVRLSLRTR